MPIRQLFENYSFKEKSTLISLLSVAGLYGAYFIDLFTGTTELTLQAMLWNMIGIVTALVVVHIIFHAVISLDDQPAAEDERDKAVARRASVWGYNVLFIGVLLTCGRVMIVGSWAEEDVRASVSLFEVANLLLASLVASEVIYYAAQLLFYRRGP